MAWLSSPSTWQSTAMLHSVNYPEEGGMQERSHFRPAVAQDVLEWFKAFNLVKGRNPEASEILDYLTRRAQNVA